MSDKVRPAGLLVLLALLFVAACATTAPPPAPPPPPPPPPPPQAQTIAVSRDLVVDISLYDDAAGVCTKVALPTLTAYRNRKVRFHIANHCSREQDVRIVVTNDPDGDLGQPQQKNQASRAPIALEGTNDDIVWHLKNQRKGRETSVFYEVWLNGVKYDPEIRIKDPIP